jgi:hypothetical protein
MEKCCVFFELRAKLLNVIWMSFVFKSVKRSSPGTQLEWLRNTPRNSCKILLLLSRLESVNIRTHAQCIMATDTTPAPATATSSHVGILPEVLWFFSHTLQALLPWYRGLLSLCAEQYSLHLFKSSVCSFHVIAHYSCMGFQIINSLAGGQVASIFWQKLLNDSFLIPLSFSFHVRASVCSSHLITSENNIFVEFDLNIMLLDATYFFTFYCK